MPKISNGGLENAISFLSQGFEIADT